MRAVQLLPVVLCVSAWPGLAWGRLCQQGTFWDGDQERCRQCTVCAAGDLEVFACQPFQDTLCEVGARRVPPPPVTDEQAHRARVAEERVRLNLQRAAESMQVERTRLESLVHEWQTTVFVVSILVTFTLVFTILAVLLRRTRTAIRKGVEDYSHLILNRETEHRDTGDQGSLAYADFDKIKIGRRAFDSPYADLSSPRTARNSSRTPTTTCAASVNLLPKASV